MGEAAAAPIVLSNWEGGAFSFCFGIVFLVKFDYLLKVALSFLAKLDDGYSLISLSCLAGVFLGKVSPGRRDAYEL